MLIVIRVHKIIMHSIDEHSKVIIASKCIVSMSNNCEVDKLQAHTDNNMHKPIV